MGNKIFVFGSNLSGIHGAGAARSAFNDHGAIWGTGVGIQGKSYAIPTKDENIKTLPLHRIKNYIDGFLEFAKTHPEMEFYVTRVGCGLAGYKDSDIGPMFVGAPPNCELPPGWGE